MSGGKNFQFMLAGETTFLQLATSGGRGGEGRGGGSFLPAQFFHQH
jgi:hypothetical protein